MNIDTRRKVVSIQLRRVILLLGSIALILAVILFGKLPNTFLGLNKYHWAIVIAVLYVFTIVYDFLMEYNYIYYSDEGNSLVLRYFSLSYINKKKKSIEIPKNEFASFVLYEELKGYKKKIVLRRFYKDVQAKYPAVSLTTLSKEEYGALLLSLNHFSGKK